MLVGHVTAPAVSKPESLVIVHKNYDKTIYSAFTNLLIVIHNLHIYVYSRIVKSAICEIYLVFWPYWLSTFILYLLTVNQVLFDTCIKFHEFQKDIIFEKNQY